MSAARLPSELLDARDRGELIVCVGPELGRDAGLPSSTTLALALLADAEAGGRNLDVATLREWIAAGRIEESLEVLERRMGARFRRVVERELGVRDPTVPALARALAKLAGQLRAVYTTGIHRVLERAFADAWPSFSMPQPDLARRRQVIVKLCGTLEFPETWSLTRAARERELGPRSLRCELLAAAGRAHCLLFVGFEPGSEIAERLFEIVAPAADAAQAPTHFVVLAGCDLEQRALLEARGLQLIEGEPAAVVEQIAGGVARRDPSAEVELPACPYPGLQAFDSAMAAVFHGRRAEVSAAASRLGGPGQRHRRWLAIDGSSGVGKSSFVHAGLIPGWRRGFAEGTGSRWWVASLRPGRRPLQALVEALATTVIGRTTAAAGSAPAFESTSSRDAVESVTSFVREHKPEGVALLVVIDQLEELVTLSPAREREQFAACLAALIQQQLIYLVTTLRSDFTAALSASVPALARLLNDAAERYTLAPISRVGLRAAIAEPAAQLGVAFELELVERIASDAAQHLGRRRSDEDGVVRTDDAALPLVAHVLRGLWDAGAAEDGAVSFAEYEALGGVSGALSRSADALLAGLDGRQRGRARELLLRMVNLDGGRLTRRSLSRAEACALAGGGREGEVLLQLLSGGAGPRLIVVRGEGAEALVDLVHEALLREWNTLRGWIAADRAQLARDEALARRAAAWTSQGRSWRSLPRGPERRELLRGRPRGPRAEEQRGYQRAMRTAAWMRGGAWLSFAVVSAGVGWVGVEQIRDAREQADANEREVERARKIADDSQSEREALEERTKLEGQIGDLLDTHQCREALVSLVDTEHEFEALLRRAVGCEAVVGLTSETSRSASVTAVAVDPDHEQIWIGYRDGTLARWPDGGSAISIELNDQAIARIVPSPSSDLVAVEVGGFTMLLTHEGEIVAKHCDGTAPDFSPDGGSLATRDGERVHVYRSRDGAAIRAPLEPGGTVRDHVFAPDGDAVIVASGGTSGSMITRHAVRGDRLLEPQITVPGLVRDIAISPSGELVASAADDQYTRLWSLERGDPVAALRVKVDNATARFVEFGPADDLLLSLSTNDKVVVTGTKLQPAFECESVERRVRPRFSPDGRWLVTAGASGPSVSLRAARSGEVVARVDPNSAAQVLDVAPDGERIVIGEQSGTTSVWTIDARDHWRAPRHDQGVYALGFASGQVDALVSGSSDRSLQRWLVGGAATAHPDAGWVIAVQAAPDGERGLALANTGALFEWSETGLGARSLTTCAPKQAMLGSSGARAAVLCEGGGVELWALDPGRPRRLPDVAVPDAAPINALALAPSGDGLALGDVDGAIRHWRIDAQGRAALAHTFEGAHAGAIRALAYDGSTTRLVSGGNDDWARLWNLDDPDARPQETRLSHDVGAVAITADATRIGLGDRRQEAVTVWVPGEDPSEVGGCEGANVHVLAFSADGDLLAAGCSDGGVHVWPQTSAARRELACQRLGATGFLPDGCTRQ